LYCNFNLLYALDCTTTISKITDQQGASLYAML